MGSATEEEQAKATYAIVGELILLSSALDDLTSKVVIAVLDLGTSPLLELVVATLDQNRKIEILKARAEQMPRGDWRNGVKKFCDKVESVLKQRNIACHTPVVCKAGVWTLYPNTAVKMLKRLDLAAKSVRPFPLDDLRTAISTGEAAFAAGQTLIMNSERANAEGQKRASSRTVQTIDANSET